MEDLTRRRLVRAVAAGATGATAGCGGSDDDGALPTTTERVDPITVTDAELRATAIECGGWTTVEATVTNDAESEASGTVVLRVGDTDARSETVTLDSGAETAVTFPVAPTARGDHRVAVGDAEAGTLTVDDAWHQFAHAGGKAASSATASGPSDAPSQAWTVSVPDGSGSPPVVHDGIVYVGRGNPYGASDRGGLLAADAEDGQLAWSVNATGAVFGAPAVAAGRIVVGTTDGELRETEGGPAELSGHLMAFDTHGEVAWSLSRETSVTTSPAVDDGVVYATTAGGTVFACDAVDGTLLWERSFDDFRATAPAVADGSVHVASWGGSVRTLAADDGSDRWSVDTGGFVGGAPTAADGTVYAISSSRSNRERELTLFAIGTDGDERWRQTTEGGLSAASPAVGEDGVYAPVGITMWGFDREDGSVRWRGPDARAGSGGGTPAVTDGTVYAGVGRVNGGLLYAFDPESGDVQWEHETDASNAALAVTDETVYATVGFRTLAAYR